MIAMKRNRGKTTAFLFSVASVFVLGVAGITVREEIAGWLGLRIGFEELTTQEVDDRIIPGVGGLSGPGGGHSGSSTPVIFFVPDQPND